MADLGIASFFRDLATPVIKAGAPLAETAPNDQQLLSAAPAMAIDQQDIKAKPTEFSLADLVKKAQVAKEEDDSFLADMARATTGFLETIHDSEPTPGSAATLGIRG